MQNLGGSYEQEGKTRNYSALRRACDKNDNRRSGRIWDAVACGLYYSARGPGDGERVMERISRNYGLKIETARTRRSAGCSDKSKE